MFRKSNTHPGYKRLRTIQRTSLWIYRIGSYTTKKTLIRSKSERKVLPVGQITGAKSTEREKESFRLRLFNFLEQSTEKYVLIKVVAGVIGCAVVRDVV